MATIAATAAGWLLLTGLTLALGAVGAHVAIIPRIHETADVDRSRLGAHASALLTTGAVLLVLGVAAVLARAIHEAGDATTTWAQDASSLLRGTEWGRAWLWAAGGSVVAAVAAGGSLLGVTPLRWLAMGALVTLAAFPAITGHATETGRLAPLTITLDTLHLWGVGMWLGGLAFVLLAESRRGSRRSLLPHLVPAFSPVGLTGVGVLAVTGLIGASIHLPTTEALATTQYGRMLALKLLWVALVLTLGYMNWRQLTPRLGDDEGDEALRSTAFAELVLAQVVLVVTAMLVRTPLPTP